MTGILALLVGCGAGDDAPTASGAPMGVEITTDDGNRAPAVTSLSFVPQRAAPGETVEAVALTTDPDGDPVSLRYVWEVGGRRMVEDGPRIRVPESAVYATIEVTVVASDETSESEPVTARFRTGNRPPRVTALDIETIQRVGPRGQEPHWQVLAQTTDPDRNDVSVHYEWIVNDAVVEEGREVFPKSRVQRGDEVRVRATPFDGQSHGPSLESPPILIGNAPPEIVSAPPDLDPSGRFLYTPEVRDADGDRRFTFALLDGPSSMSIDAETGRVEWTPTAADVGAHGVEIQVSDGLGGRSRQKFQVSVQVGGPRGPGPAARR